MFTQGNNHKFILQYLKHSLFFQFYLFIYAAIAALHTASTNGRLSALFTLEQWFKLSVEHLPVILHLVSHTFLP